MANMEKNINMPSINMNRVCTSKALSGGIENVKLFQMPLYLYFDALCTEHV